MRPFIIFLILITGFFGITPQAKENTNIAVPLAISGDLQKNLHKIARLHVELLIANGIHSIGQFDLNKFLREIPEVQYEMSLIELHTQGRFGHRYDVPQKKVILSNPALTQPLTPDFMIESQLIILHETLGALGYFDENYEISASIIALSSFLQYDIQKNLSPTKAYATQLSIFAAQRTENPMTVYNTPTPHQKSVINYYQQLAQAGGVSEGGGGGSHAGAAIKANLLTQLISKNTSIAHLNFIINQFGVEILNPLRRENGPYPVCPYNEESFNEFSSTKKQDHFLTLFLPADCKNPSSPEQTFTLIEEFINDLRQENSDSSPKTPLTDRLINKLLRKKSHE